MIGAQIYIIFRKKVNYIHQNLQDVHNFVLDKG